MMYKQKSPWNLPPKNSLELISEGIMISVYKINIQNQFISLY